MLPTPVLSVSGKGFARLRISAWHFSPAPPILYAVRAIVYHKSRVLSRVLRDFSGSEAPGTPRLNPRGTGCPCLCGVRRGAEPQRHWLSLPRGRGPSQTPKFLSPGPPSPWLPALLIGKCLCRFCAAPQAPCAGCPHGRYRKCRKRFNAGVPGAKPPAK